MDVKPSTEKNTEIVIGTVELHYCMMMLNKKKQRWVQSLELPGVKIPFNVIDPIDLKALHKEMRGKRAPKHKSKKPNRKRQGLTIRVLKRWYVPMKAMRDAQKDGKTRIQIPAVAPSNEPKINQVNVGEGKSVTTNLSTTYMRGW